MNTPAMSHQSPTDKASRIAGVILLLVAICLMVLFLTSCKKDDPAPTIQQGVPITSTLCSTIQSRLNAGETPWEVVESGVAVECLYGKSYYNGLIFWVDTVNDYASIAGRPEEEFIWEWGCPGYMHADGWNAGQAVSNDINVQLNCGPDYFPFSALSMCHWIDHNNGDSSYWRLPTRGDLFQMHENLAARGFGDFGAASYYWSSSEWVSPYQYAWAVNVSNNGNGNAPKSETRPCRCIVYVQH